MTFDEWFEAISDVSVERQSQAFRDLLHSTWDAATTSEREACADICDQESTCEGIAQKCASRIRDRKWTPEP